MTKSSSGCNVEWVWNDPSFGVETVKPKSEFEGARFPRTDCFFQAYAGGWHGWGDDQPIRRPNLGREYLVKSARERTKELIVLGILLIAGAWPTVLVMLEVFRLHHRH
jgi:hypothetical protein